MNITKQELIVHRGGLWYSVKPVNAGWLVIWEYGNEFGTSGTYLTREEAVQACYHFASP